MQLSQLLCNAHATCVQCFSAANTSTVVTCIRRRWCPATATTTTTIVTVSVAEPQRESQRRGRRVTRGLISYYRISRVAILFRHFVHHLRTVLVRFGHSLRLLVITSSKHDVFADAICGDAIAGSSNTMKASRGPTIDRNK